MSNDVRIRASLDDKVTGQLGAIKDKFDVLGKSKGFQSVVMGVGVGIGAQIWSQASGQIVNVIGDMIDAAREDEVSIQKLGTALRANVKDWDGNTDAIERTIKARVNLGFADDEQRDSLAKLVVATHDVNKALEVERTAMDLARLKGISLAEAGDALTKVEGGQFRMLKSLGIQLKAGATATDALRAVQAAAAGQAEEFAKTNEGKLLVSQAKVNEAMEKFGYIIMPAVSDAMVGVANAGLGLATVLDTLQGGVAKTTEGAQEQMQGILDWERALAVLIPPLGTLADMQQQQLDDQKAAIDANGRMGLSLGKMADDVVGAADSFGTLEGAATDWRDTYRDVAGDVIRRSNKVRSALAGDAQGIIDSYFDPLDQRAAVHDQRAALFAAEKARRNAKSAEDQQQASDDIMAALHDEATSFAKLGEQGRLAQGDVEKFTADVTGAYKAMGKAVPPEIQNIIDKLRTLAKMPNITKTITLQEVIKTEGKNKTAPGVGGHASGHGWLIYDRGGVVPGPRGSAHEAIVHGGETVRTPEQERALRSPAVAMTGGGGATFNVTVNAGVGSGLSAGDARRLADTIGPALYADMQRRGLLPRAGTGLRG